MKALMSFGMVASVVCAAILLAGCGAKDEGKKESGDGHCGHHEKGPHSGHIIDLGRDHKFHAELVEDEANESVSIYILDGDLKERPIAEPSITLILTHDGTPETFELVAAGAVDGKTARFDAADKKLHQELEAHHAAEAKLRVNIDGSQRTGQFKHADAHAH